MIACTGLTRTFGTVTAVRDLTLTLDAGEVLGLLGPNGAGKTTTIRVITGLLAPTAGTARVGGHDVLDHPARARALVGYLPEHNPLPQEMRVRAYLHHRRALYGRAGPGSRSATSRTIERCGLGEVASRRIGTLSKGFRQRVGLAAALVHDPPVLILDEPTSGLDPEQAQDTRGLLQEVSSGKTVIIVSHVLPEIERLCSRIAIIAGGALRADAAPERLRVLARVPDTITIEFAPAPDAASPDLPEPGEWSVAPLGGGWQRAVRRASSEESRTVCERTGAALARSGAAVREMRTERPSLERTYAAILGSEG